MAPFDDHGPHAERLAQRLAQALGVRDLDQAEAAAARFGGVGPQVGDQLRRRTRLLA
jgi:hypothetical protein